MGKKSRVKLSVVSMLLIACLAIMGSYAYYANDDVVVNEFVVGDVSISLEEPNFTTNPVEKVYPDQEIRKDPQILNVGHNDAYVFIEVIAPCANVATADENGGLIEAQKTQLFTWEVNDGWVLVESWEEETQNTYVYAWVGKDAPDDADMAALASGKRTGALFDTVKFASVIEKKELEELPVNVVVNGYAIQTYDINDGSAEPEGIWQILKNGIAKSFTWTTTDIDGLKTVDALGITWYKVSYLTPAALEGATLRMVNNLSGDEDVVLLSQKDGTVEWFSDSVAVIDPGAVIFYEDNTTIEGVTFPEAGIYVPDEIVRGTDLTITLDWSNGKAMKKVRENAPAEPIAQEITTDSLTLNAIEGVEYSIDYGYTWQDSPTFTGLREGYYYTVYARYKETGTYLPSDYSYSSIQTFYSFTVTADNRHMAGFPSDENWDDWDNRLVWEIPETFTYNGKNYMVTEIGENACSTAVDHIEKVVVPDSVTTIGANAFRGSYVEEVVFGKNSRLTTIEAGAFQSMEALEVIEIPEGVTSLPAEMFRYSYGLKEVYIPASVTQIGENAFYCGGWLHLDLEKIVVDKNNPSYCSVDGVLYTKDMKTLIKYPDVKKGVFVIPDSVTTIEPGALAFAKNLTSVVMPDSITTIHQGMFMASGLVSVAIPDSVTSIEDYAFARCYNLTYVAFGENSKLKSIGTGAFYSCDSLKTIEIPDSVTTIGEEAFDWCQNLTEIKFGENSKLEVIGRLAFFNCYKLTAIDIPDSVTTIEAQAFDDCDGLTSIEIGKGVTTIGENAFSSCDNLEQFVVHKDNPAYCSVDGVLYTKDMKTLICYPQKKDAATFVVPDEVTRLPEGALVANKSLVNIHIGKNVEMIGRVAWDQYFVGCTALAEITVDKDNPNYCAENGVLYSKDMKTLLLYPTAKTGSAFVVPDGVVTIGEYAFWENAQLTSVVIPDSVTSIGNYAFYRCVGLMNVAFGEESKLETIGNAAFSQCSKLTDITIPKGVTTIGTYAFSQCTGLTQINIPEGVTTIESYAFNGCTGLVGNLVLPGKLTEIKDYAFYNCSNITGVTLPESLKKIGTRVFSSSTKLTAMQYEGTKEEWGSVTKSSRWWAGKWTGKTFDYYVTCSDGSVYSNN